MPRHPLSIEPGAGAATWPCSCPPAPSVHPTFPSETKPLQKFKTPNSIPWHSSTWLLLPIFLSIHPRTFSDRNNQGETQLQRSLFEICFAFPICSSNSRISVLPELSWGFLPALKIIWPFLSWPIIYKMTMACVAPCLQSSNTHLVAISTLRPMSKHAQPKSWSIRNVSPKGNLVWCSRRGNSTTSVIRSSVAEFPAGPSSVSSKEEAIRKADAYFATDSRPIVLFDGKEYSLPFFFMLLLFTTNLYIHMSSQHWFPIALSDHIQPQKT